MLPTSNENEMEKVKMYAVVDGEYREVIELQGEITLSECDEQLWKYDYVRVVRCKDCQHEEEPIYEKYVRDCWCRKHGICVYENDYCSYGERRHDETDER